MAVAVLFLAFLVTIGGVHSQNLRLSYNSSTSYSYGRLEMYHINEWIPFTINSFDMHEADLACGILGYGFASRYATVGALGYSQSTSNYSAYSWCSTNATSFISCTHSLSTYYSHNSDVGLQCTNSRSSLRLITAIGNIGPSTGRLQIYINNTWGTVCNDGFGNQEAALTCHQLGYTGYLEFYNSGNSYQSISYGPIWLDNLKYCNSSSMDLRNCTRAVGVHDCHHSEDIVLSCYPSSFKSKDLRLISYNFTRIYLNRGRLEVYYNRTGTFSWIPFCNHGFSSDAADLACRQLGYRRASVYSTVGKQRYDSSSSNNSIGSVNCYTSDSVSLRDCTLHQSLVGCSASNQVALTCSRYGYIPIGLIVGSAIGSLVLVSCCCVGILMCVVIVTIISHKKKMGRVRTTNIAQNPSNYPMSTIAAQENDTVPTPAPPYTSNTLPSEILQQESHQPQTGIINTMSNDAYGEEKKDLSED